MEAEYASQLSVTPNYLNEVIKTLPAIRRVIKSGSVWCWRQNVRLQKVSDDTYQKAAKLFDDQYMAQLIMAINAWNRISITTRLQPAD